MKAAIENGFFISDVFLGYRQVPHFVIAVTQVNLDRRWIIRATIDTQTFNDQEKADAFQALHRAAYHLIVLTSILGGAGIITIASGGSRRTQCDF